MALAQQLNRNQVMATGRKARRQMEKLKKKQPAQAAAGGDPGVVAVDALWRKAAQEVKTNRFEAAEKTYLQLVHVKPDFAMGHYALAQVIEILRNSRDAYPHFVRAAELDPRNVTILTGLGLSLSRRSLHEAAAVAFTQALAGEPFNAMLHVYLARAQFGMDNSTAAIESYRKALEIEPENDTAEFELGNQYEVRGRFDLARACYARLIERNPDWHEVHVRLASMGDTPVEQQVAALGHLDEILATDGIDDETRRNCLFAGAKIQQRLKNYDEAFDLFVRANAVMGEKQPLDRERCVQWFELLKASFTSETFEAHTSSGVDSEQPVFIVGMPRSGTTLTEQIISSHPQVSGAGELNKVDQMVGIMVSNPGTLRYPEDVARFEAGGIRGLAEDYLKVLGREGRGASARVTDKYVFNFYHLGLIALMFPKARIIHCRRDPYDTSLSCLFQNFSGILAFPFWHKLEDIGFFYRQYEGLMAHWHEVMPGRILDVQYEETVADQERMSRMLIDHVGLEWDDACLRFYENRRSVATASVWQVRQKVYNSSIQRWRSYEKHLGPLRRELDGEAA